MLTNTVRARLVLALFAVGFGTNISSPLLLIYETHFDLSRQTVTALFAVYPIGLAPALVYAGPASDVLGRRRIMIPGMLLSGLASVVMISGADRLWLLFVGRFLLGAVSGLVFVVASAWIQESSTDNPMWAARLNGIVLYSGFGGGAFVAGILGEWAPWPRVLPYVPHLLLVVVGLIVVRSVPETVATGSGRRIRPNLGLPAGTAREFFRIVAPTALAVFGFASLAFGLFPVLLRPAMSGVAVFVTGVIGVLATAAIIPMQAWVGRIGPYRAAPVGMAIGAMGCGLGSVAFLTDLWGLLFPAAVLLGAASGVALTAGLQFVELLTSPDDRGALTGTFYSFAYLWMVMPLIVSTVARAVGSFGPPLGVVTAAGCLIAIWLRHATRESAGSPART